MDNSYKKMSYRNQKINKKIQESRTKGILAQLKEEI